MTNTVQEAPKTGPREVGVQIEAMLIEWSIPYEYVPAFPIADMRHVEGTQVREESHQYDRETAEQYAAFMREGVSFPPVVIYNDDMLVDGNTRKAAAKMARISALPAFKCRFPNPRMAVAFAGSVNQMGGRRLTTAEACEVAASLIDAGYADESISRSVGYSRTQVNNWRRETEAQDRADRTQVRDELAKLNKGAIRKLAGVKQDAPFAAATRLAAEVQPAAKDLTAVVKAIAAAPSEADALGAVEEARKDMKPTGPPPQRTSVTSEVRKARMMLPQLLGFEASKLVVADDEEWISKWRRLREHADAVVKAHG